MFRQLAGAGMVVLAVLASGCASVQMASPERDAAAKTFAVKPEKANVYVYRNEGLGRAVKMAVVLDDKPVGDTGAYTYLQLEVAPGKHKLVSKAENDSTLDLDVVAGKNYFVWQEVKMGVMSARSALQLVDDAKGKAGVAECKLTQPVQ